MKYSCKHVAIKLSESIDSELSKTEIFFIKIHLLMCRSCRQVKKQLKLLSQSINQIQHPGEKLSSDAQNRILQNIKNNLIKL